MFRAELGTGLYGFLRTPLVQNQIVTEGERRQAYSFIFELVEVLCMKSLGQILCNSLHFFGAAISPSLT